MDKRQIFEMIDSLRVHINTLFSGKGSKITKDEIEVLIKIYKEILPGTRLNTGCDSCIKYALNVVQSYYEREKPKWDAEQIPVEPVIVTPVKVTKKVSTKKASTKKK